MKIVAAVQARMGSTRLPNKAMAFVGEWPMVYRTVYQVAAAQGVDQVVLSIPDTTENDALAFLAQIVQIGCYRGAERDLLTRTLRTALRYEADAVVRITADCPLVDYAVIEEAVGLARAGYYYVSNVYPHRTFPAGIAVEVYTTELLKELDQEIEDPRYREYFMVHFWENLGGRAISFIDWEEDLSGMRWTVDYPEDLEFVRRVYEELDPPILMLDVLSLLKKHPEIAEINAGIVTDPYHGLQK